MKEKVMRFLKNYKKAFITSKNYLGQESIQVSEVVTKKIAETNCRRVVAISPLLLIMYGINIVLLMVHNHAEYLVTSMIISGILLAFTVLIDAIICWIMFFNKIDNAKEVWKFKIIYRVFWPIWFVGTAIVSSIQMENGYVGISLILTCVIANLLPLYNLKEFVVNLIFGILVIALVLWNDLSDGVLVSAKMEIICFIAMQVIGFIAQRMQLMLWMSREYLYLEAFVDPLTELLNRRGGNAVLLDEIQALPTEEEVGIIMFDVDYFKRYNDTFGHDAGDECLRMVGQTIREILKQQTKILIRHGGEEFVAILMGASEVELGEWAEKLRKAVYEKHLEAPVKDVADYVTISVGTAMAKIMRDNIRYEELLGDADQALYEAKKGGRNCVAFVGK